MRYLPRSGVTLTVFALVLFGLAAGVGGASHASEPFFHGIAPLKGCKGTTAVGQPMECRYTVMNTVDQAHDTITVDSIVDVVQTAGGAVSSGEILDEVEVIASGGATCTAAGGNGTVATPYTGATLCTLPFNASITTNFHSFYTVTAADYTVTANHRLNDTVTYGWNDLCNGEDLDGCNEDDATSQAGASTRVVFVPSVATSVNGNGTTIVARGATVFDTATLSNASPDAGGTVTYGLFSDDTCDTLVTNLTPNPNLVVNGVLPNSANYLADTLGQFWFQAVYSGDANNVGGPFESVCTSEPLKVVDANLQITPATDVNAINTNHVLTITANALNGTLGAGTATATILSGPGSFVGSPSCNYAGGAANSCTVTITSAATGTTVVQASSSIPVDTLSISRTTGTAANTAAGGSDNAAKRWVNANIQINPPTAVNPLNTNHLLTITVNALNGFLDAGSHTATAAIVAGPGSFVGSPSCTYTVVGAASTSSSCTVTITSGVAGTTEIQATSNILVDGQSITRTTETALNTAAGGSDNALKTWEGGGATLLIIDEDSLDNGIHFHPTGGLITPNGPDFFEKLEVNDDKPGHRQRDVLRYFADHVGETITVTTGRTNDEGWFAPACIPLKWLGTGKSNTCLTDETGRQTGITNYWTGPVPAQSKLDKIPWVIPLRALGLNTLVGQDVCAVVYDSDISINYDHGTSLGVNGNLQGETLGIAAFHVDQARTLNGFSSSTLPQMTITIKPTSICSNFTLFNAPVPESSSVPNDRFIPPSTAGYRSLKVFPTLPTFF